VNAKPGSDEALLLGCTCPVLDNNHGEGLDNETFWVSGDCPLHATHTPKSNRFAPPLGLLLGSGVATNNVHYTGHITHAMNILADVISTNVDYLLVFVIWGLCMCLIWNRKGNKNE